MMYQGSSLTQNSPAHTKQEWRLFGEDGSCWVSVDGLQPLESFYKCEVVWLLNDTAQFQNSLSSLGGGLRRHMAAATKRFDGQPRSTHLAGDIIESATSKSPTSWRQRVRSKHYGQRIFFTTGIQPMWILPVSQCLSEQLSFSWRLLFGARLSLASHDRPPILRASWVGPTEMNNHSSFSHFIKRLYF